MISGTSFLYMNRDFIQLENILNDENMKLEKAKKDNMGLEILELNESETSCERTNKPKPKSEALNKINWTLIEEYIFFESHKILGNKWSSITKFLPDRSDNNLKNHFYSNLRKSLRRFIKEKYNYNDIKDKLKAYYSLIYIRDKVYELQPNGKSIDTNENSVSSNKDENKASDKDENDLVNLNVIDNIYIYNLLNKEKICLEKLDNYLVKLCKSIINDFTILKLHSELFKKDNFSINLQNPEERKEFENLIRTFIFNQVMNRSYSYIKNKKSELSMEKYTKLVEFIKKHCINKQNPSEFDFLSEIMSKNPRLDLDTQQNNILSNQKFNSIENQIKNNQMIFENNSTNNLNNYLYLQNLKNLNPQVNNPILSQFNDLSKLQTLASPNLPNFNSITNIVNKIDNPMINNVGNNIMLNHNIPNNFNYLNSLLGNKTLRSNAYVNNGDNSSNLINHQDSQLGAYNLILYQNNIINNLLGLFNNFRNSVGNNVPNFYHI